MRKAAFAYWDNRIAPVFDSANQIYLVAIDSNRITAETLEVLPDDQLVQKALRLAELAVDTLVCGAISRSLHEIVCSYGIQVVPFVAGELHKVIQAWRSNNLSADVFAMPGCRRQCLSLRKCTAGRRRNIA
ncbi:MAG: NifB/NifX family molybdenum-iron cluster-binding protein [Proteobacteria bacterium]|nr:NifB/NifX family molybdenum-iron cluster-binding protein [Pseudomonadota bacterium]MBU4294511.1 NifB/NifX family molybdenum-iron cluster-binding protein [Pseudomonadota bacterium]MCG2747047.1 NifB/NifX family molybdenum-iron cluster-binding protein [Desulfobulbaceae bacterium]